MRVSTTALEIHFLTAVFYSIFVDKCRADDKPDSIWRSDDQSVKIFITKLPWEPIMPLEGQTDHFTLWIAVISVVISVAAVICICCICWKFYPKRTSRRQSSAAVLVPPASSTTVVTFQTNHDVHRGIRNPATRTGNVYSRGVLNFSFTNSSQDPGSAIDLGDGPPAYSTVISQTSPEDKPANTPYPHVIDTKKVETPPPAYVTIAPFQ